MSTHNLNPQTAAEIDLEIARLNQLNAAGATYLRRIESVITRLDAIIEKLQSGAVDADAFNLPELDADVAALSTARGVYERAG